ncbi:MAG: LamG domain-containing protein [Planctomycetes bacterium]|nr:LamG domain-containing protein [Planctomycetota bacterium]
MTCSLSLLFGFALTVCSHAGVIGYWNFDDTYANQAGPASDGALAYGTSVFSTDVSAAIGSGKSGSFDSVSAIQVPTTGHPMDSNDFNLSYFIKRGAQNGLYQRITSRGNTFETTVGQNGELSSYGGWSTLGTANEGVWTHVAWVNTSFVGRNLYVNGVLQPGTVGMSTSASGDLFLGGIASDNGESYNGLLDDVLLWDNTTNPLSAGDIAFIANNGVDAFLNPNPPVEVISVTSDPRQWMLSTERQSGGPAGTWTPTGDPLPDASTYTLAASPTGLGHIFTAAADIGVETLLGDGGNGTPEGLQFYRTTFDLDPSSDVAADIVLAVDNGAQIFINGTEVARETSFQTENWAQPYSTLSINGDGSISDVTLFDLVAPSFSDWRAGQNELVLAIRNPDPEGLGGGGLAFRMDVTGAGSPPPPELPSATVTSDPDQWMLSTVRTSGGPMSDWTPSGDPLPDASTFTLTASPTTLAHVLGAAANLGVETLNGDGGNGLPEGVQYYRTTFELDPFIDISAELVLAVDNGAAVFINGEEVARETSFDAANWASPYSSLTINEDGSIGNVTLFDWVAPSFDNWLMGENELIIAIRNPDAEGLNAGGIGLRLDVFTQVPEPSTWCLLALGGLGLLFYRRRKRICG